MKSRFTVTFKLGPKVITSILGRPVKTSELSPSILSEIFRVEPLLERLTGYRVHITREQINE
jgi:hypothetical protein